MALPGYDRGVIEPRKLRDYLLSPSHPTGKHKAAFFAVLGYSQEDWALLASDLRRLAAEGTVRESESTEYGQKHEVRGIVRGPVGREASIVTVWITLVGEDFPRFVTAYPE